MVVELHLESVSVPPLKADEQAWSSEDVAYVCDLGLVAQESDGTPHIANPIYAEVVPRYLHYAVQAGLPQRMAWYVEAHGGLNVDGLIAAFQAFFREHSEHWVRRFERYREAGPQLLLQAHLQRIVNGGGRIEREYALGRGAEAGHLIVFDRAPERSWDEKTFRRPPSGDGVPVTVWGM